MVGMASCGRSGRPLTSISGGLEAESGVVGLKPLSLFNQSSSSASKTVANTVKVALPCPPLILCGRALTDMSKSVPQYAIDTLQSSLVGN